MTRDITLGEIHQLTTGQTAMAEVDLRRELISELAAEIERLKAELRCAEAFHKEAIAERNLAWAEIERLKAERNEQCDLQIKYAADRDRLAREVGAACYRHDAMKEDRDRWKAAAEAMERLASWNSQRMRVFETFRADEETARNAMALAREGGK